MGLDLDFLTTDRVQRLHTTKPEPQLLVYDIRRAHFFLHYLIDKYQLDVGQYYNDLGNILTFLISLEIDRDRFLNDVEVVEVRLNDSYLNTECTPIEMPFMESMNVVIEGIRHYINMNPSVIDQNIYIRYNHGDLHRL